MSRIHRGSRLETYAMIIYDYNLHVLKQEAEALRASHSMVAQSFMAGSASSAEGILTSKSF